MALNIEAQKTLFHSLVEKNIHRDGIKELMEWLDSTDFFEAPASTRFHGAEAGGLCAHSIAVAREIIRLARIFNNETVGGEKKQIYTDEQLFLVALFHDVCKVNLYKQSYRNVKNDETGQWERVPCYNFEESYFVGGNGHGDKSVFLLVDYIKLSADEKAAINNHMGFSSGDARAVGDCFDHNKLAVLLHTADMLAVYCDKT